MGMQLPEVFKINKDFIVKANSYPPTRLAYENLINLLISKEFDKFDGEMNAMTAKERALLFACRGTGRSKMFLHTIIPLLHSATRVNQLKAMEFFDDFQFVTENGVPINKFDMQSNNESPFYLAAKNLMPGLMTDLLKRGADVNSRSTGSNAGKIIAIKTSSTAKIEALEVLIDFGFDFYQKTNLLDGSFPDTQTQESTFDVMDRIMGVDERVVFEALMVAKRVIKENKPLIASTPSGSGLIRKASL